MPTSPTKLCDFTSSDTYWVEAQCLLQALVNKDLGFQRAKLKGQSQGTTSCLSALWGPITNWCLSRQDPRDPKLRASNLLSMISSSINRCLGLSKQCTYWSPVFPWDIIGVPADADASVAERQPAMEGGLRSWQADNREEHNVQVQGRAEHCTTHSTKPTESPRQ